jgi:hypothetical protein
LIDDTCGCVAFDGGEGEDGSYGCATLRVRGSAGVPLNFAVGMRDSTDETSVTAWTDDCAASFCSDAHDEAASRTIVPFVPAVHTQLPHSLFSTAQQLSCPRKWLSHGKMMFSLDVPVSGEYVLSTCGTSGSARVTLAALNEECGCVATATDSWNRPQFDARNGSHSIVGTTGFKDPSWLWCTTLQMRLRASAPTSVAVVPEFYDENNNVFSLQLYPAERQYACLALDSHATVRAVGGESFSGIVVSTDSEVILPQCAEQDATNEVHFVVEAPRDGNTTFVVCPTDGSTLVPRLSVHDAACRCVEVQEGVATDSGCTHFLTSLRGPVVVGVSGRDRTTGAFTLELDPPVRDNPCPYTESVVAALPSLTCASSHLASLSWESADTEDSATYECNGLPEHGPADVVSFVAPQSGMYLLTTCVPWPFPSPDTQLLLSDVQCRCVDGSDDFTRYDSEKGLYQYLFSVGDRELVNGDDGDYDYSYFVGSGSGEGEGEGTSFPDRCSGIEVHLAADEQVILRTSQYGGPRRLSNTTAVVRVVGPVCDDVCGDVTQDCDNFSFVRRDDEPVRVEASSVTGSIGIDVAVAAVATLLLAAATIFTARRYLQRRQKHTNA